MGKYKKGRGGGRGDGGGPGGGNPGGSQQTPPEQHQQVIGRGRGRGRGNQPGGAPGASQPPPGFAPAQQMPQQPAARPPGFPPQQDAPRGRGPPPVQQAAPPPGFAPQQAQRPAAPPTQQMAGLQLTQQQGPRPAAQQSMAAAGDSVPRKAKDTQKDTQFAFVTRKAPGTQGRKTRVETNHMALAIKPSKQDWIHYDVKIEPDLPKRLLPKAVQEFIRRTSPGRSPAFDGRKNLYSCGELPFGNEHCLEVTVDNAERQNKETFKVTMKIANRIDSSLFQKYMQADNRKFRMPQENLQAVDVVLRQAASLKFTKVGRSFFSQPAGQVIDLGNGLELWHGVFQSAIMGWKPFLNIDVAHKGFPKAQPVLDLICELGTDFRNSTKYNDLKQGIKEYLTKEVSRFLKGLKVVYEIPHQPSTRRTYRVLGLTGSSARELSFVLGDTAAGKRVTVEQYFKTEKNYTLQYPLLPCLHVGNPNNKVFMPAELCMVMGGQVVLRKLDEVQTTKMIRNAATSAPIRKQKIMDAFQKLGLGADPCLREFNINVSDKMEQVEARVLEPPMLEYQGPRQVRPVSGVWRADNEKFIQGTSLKTWVILNLSRCFPDKINNMQRLLEGNGGAMGMQIAPCSQILEANGFRRDDINRKLADLKQKNCQLVVCIVQDFGDCYASVKQLAELEHGILTQCVKHSTVIKKMNDATARNILLKINAKLNGVNHALTSNCRPQCLRTPIMIMGADVTHPSPDSKDVPSVAAVTASHDPKAFKYNIEWRLQDPREEIIRDLENIVYNQLNFFFKQTGGRKPERIIFYRDGVSDGQFGEVLCRELPAIKRACKRMPGMDDGQKYEPKITFLVVQKRHHTRFFPMSRQDCDGKNMNVPPGLVVDTMITSPHNMDFYLVSHASIQGTARPTKYQVLHDDASMTEDEVEQLTYYLCHLFSRCNRSVSYPAPTYNAHLAAFRAKAYLEGAKVNLQNLDNQFAQRNINIQKSFAAASPMFFV